MATISLGQSAALLQNGQVYVQIGKGTYVSRAKIDQSLDSLTSFSEDMSKRQQRPGSRVLEAREIQPPPAPDRL